VRFKDCLVVACAVDPAGFCDLSHQRRLGSPARPNDQDDLRVAEGLLSPTLNESLEHDISDDRLIGTIWIGRFVFKGPLIGIVGVAICELRGKLSPAIVPSVSAEPCLAGSVPRKATPRVRVQAGDAVTV
jgi:hypothetical protein